MMAPQLREWTLIPPTPIGAVGLVVKASRGRLGDLWGLNVSAVGAGNPPPWFIQVFDKATAPINGDIAIAEFDLYGIDDRRQIFTYGMGESGIFCSVGISLAGSTTSRVLTLVGADTLQVRGMYL